MTLHDAYKAGYRVEYLVPTLAAQAIAAMFGRSHRNLPVLSRG